MRGRETARLTLRRTWPSFAKGGDMQKRNDKEHGQAQAETDDEQVICSNELLAVIRERMKQRREEEAESGNNSAD